MKRIAFLSLLVGFTSFNFVGCKSTLKNSNSFIPYLLPLKTERMIFDKMRYISIKKEVAFYFDFQDNGTIHIWVDSFSNGYDEETRLSHRKVFINDKFYPLSFSTDETFQATLEGGKIVVEKNCYYHKPDRKEVTTKTILPILSEREKLFPYVDDEPCQISQRRTSSIRHQGYLLTVDIKGNIVEVDQRPDGLKKIENQ